MPSAKSPIRHSRKPMEQPEVLLVRICPYAPSRGNTIRTYILSGSPYPPFKVEKGWYEVDKATALKLEKIRTNHLDPSSRPVFQVVTRQVAEALDEAEDTRAAAASAPVPMPKGAEGSPDLTTEDLEYIERETRETRPKPLEPEVGSARRPVTAPPRAGAKAVEPPQEPVETAGPEADELEALVDQALEDPLPEPEAKPAAKKVAAAPAKKVQSAARRK